MKRDKRQREKWGGGGGVEGERIWRKEREKISQAVRQRFSDSRSCDRHKANAHTHIHIFSMKCKRKK